MKKWLMTVVFGSVLDLGECGGGGDNGASNNAANGNNSGNSVDASEAEEVYKENCASCHGEDLEGASGPELTTVGADMSEDEIATQIDEGGDGMPADFVEDQEDTTVAQWLADQTYSIVYTRFGFKT